MPTLDFALRLRMAIARPVQWVQIARNKPPEGRFRVQFPDLS